MKFAATEDFYLFGYGSLIWKPPPDYDYKMPGYIKDYVRRFWQVLEDHRGTPEAPGRVVTLVERSVWETLGDHHGADEEVWGMAYRIPKDKVESVKEYLDIREINGYSIHYVDVYHTDEHLPPIKALVYIGTPENPQFAARNGVPGESELAKHIFDSCGPSGENKEYLYQLNHSLEELCPESKDNHVRSLFRQVCLLEAEARLNGVDHSEDEQPVVPSHHPATVMEETELVQVGGEMDIDTEMMH
ncbi:ChaC-like protein [Tricharina praecox]|uniref:ChaC-like protein n=1 Tax=Tricharina praecox TaxID=43433 RepID=UPI002220B5D2|nr:ChaC-like protein [Tricharina praecox]KAI5844218.1 ChaC-like protein [Tricharina praecox]